MATPNATLQSIFLEYTIPDLKPFYKEMLGEQWPKGKNKPEIVQTFASKHIACIGGGHIPFGERLHVKGNPNKVADDSFSKTGTHCHNPM